MKAGILCFWAEAARRVRLGVLILLLMLVPASVTLADTTIGVTPNNVNFGNQPRNEPSDPRTIAIRNTGDTPVTFNSINIAGPHRADFSYQGASTGFLGVGGTRTITVRFTPRGEGTRTATLSINTNAQGSPHTVALRGNGVAAVQLAIQIDPNTLNFGPQQLNSTSDPRTVTIRNTGNTFLTMGQYQVTGTHRQDFAVQGASGGFLAAGGTRTLTVRFTPRGEGTRTATLSINSNAPGSPHTVSLVGVGQAPVQLAIQVQPTTLDFGPQEINTTSDTRTVTIRNTGNTFLTMGQYQVTGTHRQDFAVQGASGGFLAAGGTRTLNVRFTPRGEGNRTANLSIASNAPGNPHTVSLMGVGRAPVQLAIEVEPTTLNFGPQEINTTSSPRTVTIRNTGNTFLTMGQYQVTGAHRQDFAVQGASGGFLAAGGTRTLTVRFTPRGVGNRTATLSILSNAPGTPHSVNLIGNGREPVQLSLQVEPATLNFGPHEVNETSGPRTVLMRNTGNAPVTIGDVQLTGTNRADFRVLGAGGGFLAPGGTRPLSILFTPRGLGTRTATLSINSNAPGSPHNVSLIGTGEEPPQPGLQLQPTFLDFGEQELGSTSQPRTVTIRNTGNAPVTVSNAAVSGIHAQEFAFLGAATGALPPGGTRTLSVRFTPQGPGNRSAVLSITSNAPGSPHTVTLTGFGAEAATTPDPGADGWPVFLHDPRQLGLTSGTVEAPQGLSPWSVPLGSRPGTSPVIHLGVAYVGTEANGVQAIDLATRTVRWNRPLPAPVRSAPAVGDPVVVVSAGGLFGLNAADGSILWQRPDIVAHEEVSPMIVGDTAYIGHRGSNGSGAVMHALNVATGANVWPQPAPLPAGFEQQVTASADPDLGLLFVGLGLPPTPERTETGPSVVVALRLEDGSNAWLIPAAFPGSPPPTGLPIGWVAGATPDPQPALFVAAGSRVTALDARTGATLWVRPLPETELPPAAPDRRAVLLQPPVVASADPQGATLFVGGASGRIYALDSNTGQDAIGGLATPIAPIIGTLAMAGNYLYLPTTTNLAAVDVQAGTVVWESPLSAGSGVVIVGGSPYVGTMEGQFVGFSR